MCAVFAGESAGQSATEHKVANPIDEHNVKNDAPPRVGAVAVVAGQ